MHEEKKQYLRALQIDEGWKIGRNLLTDADYEEDTWIFEAFNFTNGTYLDVHFRNEDIGYELMISTIKRKNGDWAFKDESQINLEIIESKNINDIAAKVNEIIFTSSKDILSIKVYGAWAIAKNNLQKTITNFKETELLFFATSHKRFIDVSYVKSADKPFKICFGKNKYKLRGIHYAVYNPIEIKESELETIEEVVESIENIMITLN